MPNRLELPLIHLAHVYHWGSGELGSSFMASSPRAGRNLAVSLCPLAQRQIEGRGGLTLYALRCERASFVDLTAVKANSRLRDRILGWAENHDLMRRAVRWEGRRYNEVTDLTDRQLFHTEGQAQRWADPDAIDPVAAVVARPALTQLMGDGAIGIDATDAVIMAWVRRALPELLERPPHGVWWREPLDVAHGRYPSGAIFPPFIRAWRRRKISAADLKDDQLLLQMQPTYQQPLQVPPAQLVAN